MCKKSKLSDLDKDVALLCLEKNGLIKISIKNINYLKALKNFI